MEDEDDHHNQPPPPPPPIPNQNGRFAQPVTVAAPPPQNMLTLALPIQQPRSLPATGGGGGGGGGREDCWSEGATSTLIDAWGERYLELSRGNLKQQHWKDVADIVSSRQGYTKPPKTDVQCKNRIDTLKKKYKTEKAKIASGSQGDSKWTFFHRLDRLIGIPTPIPTTNPTSIPNSRIPLAIPVNLKVNSFYKHQYQRPHSDSLSDNPLSPESSDSLPPPDTLNRKRPRLDQNADKGESWGNSIRELTRAILEFGEVYERMEITKLQQELELEKQRMRFAKELETQRMQLLMKTQLELLQLMNGGKKSKNSKNSSSHQQEKNKNKSSKFD